MDEARRYHFPFHAYYPSQPVSALEADPTPQYNSSDVENQQYSPSGPQRRPLAPESHSDDLHERSSTRYDRPFSSVDPRTSLSPSTAASDRTNTYTEKKDLQLSQATGGPVAPPGLQAVWPEEADKEGYRVAGFPSGTPSGKSTSIPAAESARTKRRVCGLPVKWLFVVASLVACIIIGLAVGLGVGLGSHHSSRIASTAPPITPASTPQATGDPNYDIGGSLNPLYYSTDGAFNGSGIALATSTFDQSGYGSINLYFQYHDGSIRWLRLLEDGSWQGGTIAEIIAADAKNATPIAAVAYAMNQTSTWHIFYIDTDNLLRQKTYTNVTNLWQDGPINNLNVRANNKPMVGLQACWFGNLYGDSEYIHSPQFGPNASTTAGSDSTVGMHLFIGDTDTSFQQYGWLHGEDDWTAQDQWPNMNAQAGVGCYSWGPGTVTYVFMVDLNNALNIYWKDTNSSLPGNDTHPINKWVNSKSLTVLARQLAPEAQWGSYTKPLYDLGSIAVSDLHPSSSLGYTNYLYAQLADETIHGYNISFDAENTAFVPGDNFQIEGLSGVPGTHLSVTSLSNPSGGASILAFYQTHGDDITGYSRDKYAGQWTGSMVTIPPN